jgi:hypothetical protein
VRAVLPVDPLNLDEPQIGFVHEGRGLQRMTRPLMAHMPPREPAQLVVDQRHEPVERSRLTAAPGHQQLGRVRRLVPNALHSTLLVGRRPMAVDEFRPSLMTVSFRPSRPLFVVRTGGSRSAARHDRHPST